MALYRLFSILLDRKRIRIGSQHSKLVRTRTPDLYPVGSDSIRLWREPKDARPKSGRPLQNQLPQTDGGFVEASPSRVLRDGEGKLPFKLSHYDRVNSPNDLGTDEVE